MSIGKNMENQATKKTFKTEHYQWIRHDTNRWIRPGYGETCWRRWSNESGHSTTQYMDEWGVWCYSTDDVNDYFSVECKLALRALVGPPPNVTDEAAAEAKDPEPSQQPHISLQADQLSDDISHLRVCYDVHSPEGLLLSAIPSVVSEFVALRKKIHALTGDRDCALGRVTQLQEESNARQARIIDMNHKLGEARALHSDLERERDAARARVETLERVTSGDRAVINGAQDRYNKMRSELDIVTRERDCVMANHELCVQQRDAAVREHDELLDKLRNVDEVRKERDLAMATAELVSKRRVQAELERDELRVANERLRSIPRVTYGNEGSCVSDGSVGVKALQSVMAERDGWVNDFRALSNRVTWLQTEIDRKHQALEHSNAMIGRFAELVSSVPNGLFGSTSIELCLERAIEIDKAYWNLVKAVTNRHAPIEHVLNDLLVEFFQAFDAESEVASVIACPSGEPMHFHHDGCGACMGQERNAELRAEMGMSGSLANESVDCSFDDCEVVDADLPAGFDNLQASPPAHYNAIMIAAQTLELLATGDDRMAACSALRALLDTITPESDACELVSRLEDTTETEKIDDRVRSIVKIELDGPVRVLSQRINSIDSILAHHTTSAFEARFRTLAREVFDERMREASHSAERAIFDQPQKTFAAAAIGTSLSDATTKAYRDTIVAFEQQLHDANNQITLLTAELTAARAEFVEGSPLLEAALTGMVTLPDILTVLRSCAPGYSVEFAMAGEIATAKIVPAAADANFVNQLRLTKEELDGTREFLTEAQDEIVTLKAKAEDLQERLDWCTADKAAHAPDEPRTFSEILKDIRGKRAASL